MRRLQRRRKGAVALLLCFMMVPLLTLFAFSIDYGFLLFVRTDLQRAVDNAALAAVQDLVPDDFGNQDLDKARETVRKYIQENLGDDFVVLDEDIEIGRYNPKKIYGEVELLDSGIRDAIRITIRRNGLANKSVFLFFARIFDKEQSKVLASATAILQKGRYLADGTDILPITVSEQAWNRLNFGDEFSIYGDGRMTDSAGYEIVGNWGTIDVGAKSNSTSDLKNQIIDGISQSDLDKLEFQGAISTNKYIDSQDTITLNGDTGFSAGLKNGIDAQLGESKIIPIYRQTSGQAGSLTFTVIGWGVVRIRSASWNGSINSSLTVRRGNIYDSDIVPPSSLSDTSNIIDGVYTSPTLVE